MLDPSIAAILSTLVSAASTALLMYAAYHWPAGRNEADDDRAKHLRYSDEDEHDQNEK